jgi:hypothetical protein
MQQLPSCSGSVSQTLVLRSWCSWSLVWSFISPEWVWVAFASWDLEVVLDILLCYPSGARQVVPLASSIFITMNTSRIELPTSVTFHLNSSIFSP